MKAAITEVTIMRNDHRCVAAWAYEDGLMIRPMPGGEYWSRTQCEALNIEPGAVVDFGRVAFMNRQFPHRTEDRIFSLPAAKCLQRGGQWPDLAWPTGSSDIQTAFSGNVVRGSEFQGFYKCFVPERTECASLVGITADPGQLHFWVDEYDGKRSLRAHFEDDNGKYNLPVTASEILNYYQEYSVDGCNGVLSKYESIHVRIGLATAWDGGRNQCYLQLNGVIF